MRDRNACRHNARTPIPTGTCICLPYPVVVIHILAAITFGCIIAIMKGSTMIVISGPDHCIMMRLIMLIYYLGVLNRALRICAFIVFNGFNQMHRIGIRCVIIADPCTIRTDVFTAYGERLHGNHCETQHHNKEKRNELFHVISSLWLEFAALSQGGVATFSH